MSKLELLKFLQTYGEETELGDFTPEQLQEMIDAMQEENEGRPLTIEEFKAKYFEYYDDVKDKSLKRQDW
ncbi:MAG: hypothetical protein IJX98_02830 [Clostridia bacterium]|nr:hypothetical protein [Clostridia bacterium]